MCLLSFGLTMQRCPCSTIISRVMGLTGWINQLWFCFQPSLAIQRHTCSVRFARAFTEGQFLLSKFITYLYFSSQFWLVTQKCTCSRLTRSARAITFYQQLYINSCPSCIHKDAKTGIQLRVGRTPTEHHFGFNTLLLYILYHCMVMMSSDKCPSQSTVRV